MQFETQVENLRRNWPSTYNALRQTFYQSDSFGQTTADGKNDAGYLVQALARYKRAAQNEHAHRNLTAEQLDRAAAREVWYQHNRDRKFRRACAALAVCFNHLVTERPERLFAQIGGKPNATV